MPSGITTQEESKLLNSTFFEKLGSRDYNQVKEAEDAATDFTRTTMREDGFYRRILPMMPITNDKLSRMTYTDKPIVVVDKEPGSPAAMSVPFATLPTNLYIEGDRYEVTFDRILTPRFTKDVDELRTWQMDIRQVLSDNSIKDMLAEEDSKFLLAVNTGLVGQGAICPTSGVVQWQAISGGITRDTLWDGLKIMPSTPSNLEVHTILINNITIKDVCKFGRDEMGGDLSQEIMRNGWTYTEFMGKTWVITIKKQLVPTGTMYYFGDPKFIGKSYSLEETVLYVKRDHFMIEFFAYETIGGALGHLNAIARSDYV
jgi:hypothetical protein